MEQNQIVNPLEFEIFDQSGEYKMNGIGQSWEMEMQDECSRKENWISFVMQLFDQLHHHSQQGTMVFRLGQSPLFTWEGGQGMKLCVQMQKDLRR